MKPHPPKYVQDKESSLISAPAQLLLTCWIIFVALFYFGGYLLPQPIGSATALAGLGYALMLTVSVVMAALSFVRSKNTHG